MKSLNDAERGRLYTAMLEYSMTGEASDLRGNERFVFDGLRVAIDRDRTAYARKCAINRENGEKGAPNYAPERGANGGERGRNSQDEEKEKDESYTPPIIPPARFRPPTVEEVRAYCTERQNRVDPSQFVDFYISKGWKVGGQGMKDWKAAVRTWEKRDEKIAKNTRAQNHEQRKYPDANSVGARDLLEEGT